MFRKASVFLVAAILALGLAHAAAGSQTFARPSGGVFHFVGNGYGHGLGMSQWGAQGGALTGATADEILDAYYAGTTSTVRPGRFVRVRIDDDEGRDLRIAGQRRLTLVDVANGKRFPLVGNAAQWRIVSSGSGLALERGSGGTWQGWSSGAGGSAFDGPLRFVGRAPLRLLLDDGSWHEYRGSLQAVRDEDGSFLTVNRVPLEKYLYAVASREMSMWFEEEAIKAQAIAARSYTLNRILSADTRPFYDICSNSWDCAAYGGIRAADSRGNIDQIEHPRGIAAVLETHNVVRLYDGQPIFAMFSASNGGWERAWDNWPPKPYLISREDKWDAAASPHGGWTAAIPASRIEEAFPDVGYLTAITVLARDGGGDWGGRVTKIELVGTRNGKSTSVTLDAGELTDIARYPDSTQGLRSSYWTITG